VTTVASLLLQASSSSLSPNHHPWHGMHSTNAQNGSMAQHQQAAAHETRGALPCSLLPFCSAFWRIHDAMETFLEEEDRRRWVVTDEAEK